MIKLLIGGSPCTYWSIAQKNGRETEASGIGWELFKNYLIAKEKFKPDFFLYENNKSAAQPIKDQISHELGVPLMHINSALVSAQNRQRFYAFNWEVEQPEDRGIVLRDVLETSHNEIGYELCEPFRCLSDREMDYMVRDTKGKYSDRWTYLQKPGENDKALCLTANLHKGVPYNICAEPVRIPEYGESNKSRPLSASYSHKGGGEGSLRCDAFPDNPNKQVFDYVAVLTDEPVSEQFNGEGKDINAMKRVYEVKDGLITIKGKRYPIKLEDGHYIIRKLTPVECERLQTLPDGYTKAVSNTQRYKVLGNGWTAEVIIHILNGALKDVPRDEEIVVLSMYDGIGTGRYCLDKMGFTNVKYFASEVDRYAMRVATSNYPDIMCIGDAFNVRNEDWSCERYTEHLLCVSTS